MMIIGILMGLMGALMGLLLGLMGGLLGVGLALIGAAFGLGFHHFPLVLILIGVAWVLFGRNRGSVLQATSYRANGPSVGTRSPQ